MSSTFDISEGISLTAVSKKNVTNTNIERECFQYPAIDLCSELCSIVGKAISSGKLVGASIIVAKDGTPIFENHAGFANREKMIPVKDNTIFRLASMTKPIVISATLKIVENGELNLDDLVTKFFPEFKPKLASGVAASITIKNLVTHTAGLTYGFAHPDNEPYESAGVSDGLDERVLTLEENLRRISTVPLLFEPGKQFRYSLSVDVLGGVIESICKKPLSEIIKDLITVPLGMHDTCFSPSIEQLSRLSEAYADNPDPKNPIAQRMKDSDQVRLAPGCGLVRYTPSRVTNKYAYLSAGVGMLGTANDYFKFMELIRNRGFNKGERILSEESIKYITTDLVPDLFVPEMGVGYGFSGGFAIARDPIVCSPKSVGTYEWGGVYGSKVLVDPVKRISIIILTNTAMEGLMGNSVAELVKCALTFDKYEQQLGCNHSGQGSTLNKISMNTMGFFQEGKVKLPPELTTLESKPTPQKLKRRYSSEFTPSSSDIISSISANPYQFRSNSYLSDSPKQEQSEQLERMSKVEKKMERIEKKQL